MAETHGGHWLEREDCGDITVVRVKATARDEDTVRAVFDPICSLSGVGRNRLVVNLGGAAYLPSMAVGKLVLLNRKVQADQGRLALCQLSPGVKDVLESTHLNELFNIYATEQEAMQSFAQEVNAPG